MTKAGKKFGVRLAGSSLLAFAQQASAAQEAIQQGAAATEARAPAADAGDIVVTARRRAEALERVPVTVSVLSAEALTKQNVTSQSDLQTATPGLIVRSSQGSSQFNYAIRGQSIDSYSASQPGVLSYVNEFQTTALSAGSFYDLAGVQVLKGPQGTLFGRNTTGGAVLFSTVKPEFDASGGYLRTRLGELGLRQLEGAVGVPLTDRLAVRVAGSIEKRDGYILNLVTNRKLNDIDRKSIRGTLRWKPTDAVETTFVGEYNKTTSSGEAQPIYSAYAPGSVGPDGRPLVTSAATFYSSILDSLAGAGSFASLLAARPQTMASGFVGQVALQRARGNYAVALDAPLGLNARSYYILNTTTIDIGDAQLKNIVGYSSNRNSSDLDNDGTAFPFYAGVHVLNRSEALSEEINLSGKAFSGRLDYIVGAYYSRDKRRSGQDFSYFDLGPLANVNFAPAFGVASLPLANALYGDTNNSSIGGYVQASYKFDGALQGFGVTGGLRYTKETNKFTYVTGFQPAFQPGVEERRSDSKPSWTVGLEYQAAQDLFLYANYRGSWRGGGFNHSAPPINLPSAQGGNSFGPETIQDVEVGFKYRGDIGSVPVRLSVAGYQSWVKDVQRVAYVTIPGTGPAAVTINVPKVTFKGIDADGDVRLTPWLRVGGAFNYTVGKYGGGASQNIFGTLLEFSTIADVPKYSGSVFMEASTNLGGDTEMRLRADGYAQSRMYFSNFGRTATPDTQLPSYKLVNMRLSVEHLLGPRFSAALFAKNLFDKQYYVGGIALGAAGGYNLAVPGTPRIVGLEFGVNF